MIADVDFPKFPKELAERAAKRGLRVTADESTGMYTVAPTPGLTPRIWHPAPFQAPTWKAISAFVELVPIWDEVDPFEPPVMIGAPLDDELFEKLRARARDLDFRLALFRYAPDAEMLSAARIGRMQKQGDFHITLGTQAMLNALAHTR